MTLQYGFLKCRVTEPPSLKASRRGRETQYHLHASLSVPGATWDCAINVGTNDADDLLEYVLVYDFHHPVIETLRAAQAGFTDLTSKNALPAIDVERSDILSETGAWRESDVLDGTLAPAPVAALVRLFARAIAEQADVYVFGRTYKQGGPGIHDVHVNQGSSGGFLYNGKDDHNDHNDVWQDGAFMVDLGNAEWAAYFAAFSQQAAPTDDLGNPAVGSRTDTRH